MKRIHLSLIALGLVNFTTALAALPTPTNTESTMITVPTLYGNFIVGGTLYFIEATATQGDSDYANINPLVQPNNNFASSLHRSNVSYDWQYGFNLGYIFSDTANDVGLNYFYVNTDASHHEGTLQHPFFITIPNLQFNTDFFQNGINHVDTDNQYRLNVLDLIAGQYIDVGCRLRLHPTAGVRYIDLERNLNSIYLSNQTSSSDNNFGLLTTADDSDYSGIGPMVGLDASYYLGMGFGVVGHADTAVTMGSLDYQTEVGAITFANINAPSLFQDILFRRENFMRVVPILDAKLGLDYTYMFYSMSNDDLTVELGYAVNHYFNAVDRFSNTLQIGVPNLASNTILGTKTSGVGIDGPYVNFTFHV